MVTAGRPVTGRPLLSPSLAAYACGALLAAAFAVLLARIPVQVSDCINHIGAAFTQSWSDLVASGLGSEAYWRPMIHPPIKLVLELAPGREFAAFRAVHVLQVFAAIGLFVRVLQVHRWPQLAGALVALAILTGSHVFATLIREGYPINTYFTVALCALVAVNVAMEPRARWWTDLLVAIAFVVAVGTIENGLLVWVIVAAAAIAGCRGVSRAGVVALTALTVAYFALRFLVLDVGMPNLLERSSGFGLDRLEPAQLVERFGDNPWPLYAYNAGSAVATVLVGEPRNGTFTLARAVAEQSVRPWMVVELLGAVASTALIGWYAWTASWRRAAGWTRGQRLLFVTAGVVAANAAIAYPYAKDQVMSVAAIFVALAGGVAVGALVEAPPRGRVARAGAAVLILAAASCWSLRVAGQQHLLVHTAFVTRNDWAIVDPDEVGQRFGGNREFTALIRTLRTRALEADTAYPHVWASAFAEDWFAH